MNATEPGVRGIRRSLILAVAGLCSWAGLDGGGGSVMVEWMRKEGGEGDRCLSSGVGGSLSRRDIGRVSLFGVRALRWFGIVRALNARKTK